MEPQSQPRLIVTIQRPPFYRPPRCRPVTFEKPTRDESRPGRGATHVVRFADVDNQVQRSNHDKQEASQSRTRNMQTRSLANLPDYNRTPQPFNARNYEHQRYQPQHGPLVAPKIVIEEHGAVSPASQSVATTGTVGNYRKYPTSTVHKSMLNSCRSSPLRAQSEARFPPEGRVTTSSGHIERGPDLRDKSNESDHHIGLYPQPRQAVLLGEPQGGGDDDHQDDYPRQDNYQLYQTLPSRLTWRKGQPMGHHHGANGGGRLQAAGGGVCLPDSKRDEFIKSKRLEQTIIARQNYRTLPIVSPKPKARHDLATGSYMRLESQDPTFVLALNASSPTTRPYQLHKLAQLDEQSWRLDPVAAGAAAAKVSV